MVVPAPNAIFLGDRSETQCKMTDVCGVGTMMVNPGCFADDGSFAIYNPSERGSEREVDLSVVSAGDVKHEEQSNLVIIQILIIILARIDFSKYLSIYLSTSSLRCFVCNTFSRR